MWNTKWLICTAVHFVIKCAVFWYFVGFEGYVRNIARGQKRLNILVVCYWISYMQTLSTHLSWQFRPCMVKQFPGQSPMVIYWCLFLVDTACNHVLRNNESRQHNFQHWMQVWTLVTHYCILHFEQLGKVNLTKSTIQPVKVHLHMLCVVVCACFCLMCNIVLDI